jgi:excisionase family DNA binding protein
MTKNVMKSKRRDVLRNPSDKVMTVEELSQYLHIHRSTVYRLLKRREIPAFRIGSDWRFNIETIDVWRSNLETNH